MTKEEKTNDIEKIRQLEAERDSIIKQLEKLEKKSQFLINDIELSERIMRKKGFLFEIERMIEFYSFNPVCTNGFIDLYNDPLSNKYYLVCFHGEKEPIGVLGFGDLIFTDNVSYCIYEKYQNKGLGFQSVCLFLEYLNSKGIESVTIHVEKTNLPSLRIAEKLKDIYQSYSVSEYNSIFAFHFCLANKKLESNSMSN